jgi:Ricin-type beta-trefoil lectin domain-like
MRKLPILIWSLAIPLGMFAATEGRAWEIRDAQSNRCLDADTGTIGSNGTKVQLWDCWGGQNQMWINPQQIQ